MFAQSGPSLALTFLIGALSLAQSRAEISGLHYARVEQDPDGIWETISPSANLSWVACYDSFQCAKLAVPLDYANSSGTQAAIALLKIPSKVPAGSEGYRGPVLFNPGGPGESGVDLVRTSGSLFQTILGDGYDLVGFDVRGTYRSTPQIVVFTDPAEKARWYAQLGASPPLNSTADAVARMAAVGAIVGGLAEKRARDTVSYVGTALVARDMLSIVRAHGQEKLQYWGFSYGSLLGTTFAGMFPSLVERMVVDGIEDSDDYYHQVWMGNLNDTDKAWHTFLDACAQAGPDLCALHDPDVSRIKARVDNILNSLKLNPLPVLGAADNTTEWGIVDYQLVKQASLSFLYRPFTGAVRANTFAALLAAIERGDGEPAWAALGNAPAAPTCPPTSGPQRAAGVEVQLAIACGDGDRVNSDVDALKADYERVAQTSSFADVWPIHYLCSGWKVKASERFNGPYGGNTSFPLLFVGNTADPVTPLANAHKMATGFKDAVVLTVDTPGHTSLAATSTCVMQHVREYFQEGRLPAVGTTCAIENVMFGNATAAARRREESSESAEFVEAVRELSRRFVTSRLPF